VVGFINSSDRVWWLSDDVHSVPELTALKKTIMKRTSKKLYVLGSLAATAVTLGTTAGSAVNSAVKSTMPLNSVTNSATTPAAQRTATRFSLRNAMRGPASLDNRYIVRASGSIADAERAITHAGGRVTSRLEIVNSVAADLTPAQRSALAASTDVDRITANAALKPMGAIADELGFDPDKDKGSPRSVGKEIGADKLWNSGLTGKGIDVAVIDTGVNPVKGLEGRVIDGPDLSFDVPFLTAAQKSRDMHGHGTHMAGIIAGRDPEVTDLSKPQRFIGIAPEARIVNVRVGAASGAVDVSQVISGIEWVVRNKQTNGLNIRVINLSYGTPSTLNFWDDPVAAAAEAAWKSGIVVVVAAGNDGSVANVTSPASSPMIIAAGATGRKQGVTTFTNSGGARNPDLWAPGSSVVSLTAAADDNVNRHGRPGAVGTRFRRGTGTSQSSAVISGAAALLLQAYPNATPDQIRIAMIRSNSKDPLKLGQLGGVGEMGSFVNLDRAIKLLPVTGEADTLVRDFVAKFKAPVGPRGSGSLDATRGANIVVAANGTKLTGNIDWMGNSWSGNSWSGNSWSGNSWSGTSWSGNSWSGNSWSGNSWSGNSWSGNSWSGNSWSGNSWSGNSWSGSGWTGNSWSGNSWSGNSWSSNVWADYNWF
jgi:serine protease AprX